MSDIGIRILTEGVYTEFDKDGNKIEYKSASFDETLFFTGEKGLLNRFYSGYKNVLYRPVVVEFAVRLSDVELHQFSENNPVYIDGVYYMPITVTVQTNGIANCKAIKMPPGGKYFKPSLIDDK